jgi:hypothetical protein
MNGSIIQRNLKEQAMKRLIATIFLFLSFTSWAIGQTVVPLNTGFNHLSNSPYATGAQDNYWINLASSLPTIPPTGPAYAVQSIAPWQPDLPASGPIPATRWINARNGIAGKVDPVTGMGYSLYRKCFCLMSFTQAKLAFDLRADDNVTVWLNTMLSAILPASIGGYANPVPLHGGTTDQTKFKIGINCLYVLVEDVGGYTGFDLRGYISAYGLMPMPASGTETSFAPCGCDFKSPPHTSPTGAAQLREGGEFDDRQVVADIVKFAETRRAARAKPAAK